MAILEIDGVGKVEVGDEFKTMAPDQQEAFVNNIISEAKGGKKSGFGISSSMPAPAAPEDPIRQRARAELQSKGLLDRGNLANMTDMARKGYTFGFNDELAAAALTPIEMFRQGTFNPAEAYRFAKAREDILQEEAKKATGNMGLLAEVVGGASMGGKLAQGGLSLMKPGQGALARIGAGAAEGGLYGATSGIGDAKSLQDVPAEGIKGGLLGAGIGAGLTAAAPIVNTLGRNALGWASATINPQRFAERQVARGLSESGMTANQVAQEVAAGQAAGQPYTVADAMGNAGQRLLSTVTRAPGEGRTMAVNFLEARQGDQGRRIANLLAEGMNAPYTAAQTGKTLEATRKAAADTNYAAARGSAGAIDVTPAIQKADDFLQPGVTKLMNPGTNIADDSVEAAVRRARSYLTDGKSQITDFDQALRAKMELDNLIDNARGTVQRQLIPIKNALDDALAAASKPYANARDTYKAHSKIIEALDTGRQAATRGRTEDTLNTFGKLTPGQQQSFRVGYADPLIESVQGGAFGQNKARPLSSLAMQTELPAFAAPGQAATPNLMATRGQNMMSGIARENRMFETRAAATGGSKTADNLADMQAMGVDPVSVIGNAISGNYLTAARNLVSRSAGALSGNTPQVRENVAKLLISGGADIQKTLTALALSDEARRRVLASYLSGTMAGAGEGMASNRR